MRLAHIATFTLAILFLNASAIAQSATCEGVPALTVIAKNGERSTLIGSYHVGAAGLRQPAKSVMDNAKHYVVEHVEFPKMPPAKSQRAAWSKALSEEQISVLRERVSCNLGTVVNPAKVTEVVLSFYSAAFASNIAMFHCAPQKLASRDAILNHTAKEHGLINQPLESNEQAERQRQAVPEHIYRHILYTALTPASEQGQRRAIDALNSGNYDEIISALRDLSASPSDADKYIELMISERNRAWIPALMKFFDEGNAFVNVGASHLAGPDGLIQLLRGNGYVVDASCLPAETQ